MKTKAVVVYETRMKVFRFSFKATVLAVTLTVIGITPPAVWAMVQPEGIPPGRYTISGGGGAGSSPGGGRGTGIIPSYCLDERLAAPPPDSSYRSILAGGGSAKVRLPNGTEMSLKDAIDSNVISISGDEGLPGLFGETEHRYDRLKVSGPEGAVIEIGEPLALSAEPWLQNDTAYKFDPVFWKKASEELKRASSQHDEQIQSRIWDNAADKSGMLPKERREFEKLFGNSGKQILETLSKLREIEEAHLSRLGKQPVFRVTSTSGDDYREDIIVLENGKAVRHPFNTNAQKRQEANINARLSPLTSTDVAFLAKSYEGRWLFIADKEGKPTVIESGLLDEFESTASIAEWLKKKAPAKPNLIVVSETGEDTSEVSSQLREEFGDSVRILEDDDPDLAVKNVKAQKKIKSGKDVAVYWDEVISRAGFVPAMAASFRQAEISFHDTPDVISAGNLILVSGHKASNYRNYLAQLAAKGVLKGKSVALLSCGEDSDREFCRYLIEQGGAVSVLRINEIIPESVVPSVLREICERIPTIPKEGVFLEELIRDAVNSAVQKTRNEGQKERLKILLDHSIQVSQLSN